MANITKQLLQLLDEYGAAELEAAMEEALSRDVPHHNAVRLSLQKRREEKDLPPPLPSLLPKDKRARELIVRPHKLSDYDQLQQPLEKENDDTESTTAESEDA